MFLLCSRADDKHPSFCAGSAEGLLNRNRPRQVSGSEWICLPLADRRYLMIVSRCRERTGSATARLDVSCTAADAGTEFRRSRLR